MSYTNSNLYSSRIYAEHPVATWAMDDESYFLSLTTSLEKEIYPEYWNFNNSSSSNVIFDLSGYPFEELDVNKIHLATGTPKEFSLSLKSSILQEDLDPEKGSICVSSYIYIPEETSISELQIGFTIDGEDFYRSYNLLNVNIWEKISYTNPIFGNDSFKPFIKVKFFDDVDVAENKTSVYFNGVSVGQWSEPYNSVSTGIFLDELPNNVKNLLGYSDDIDIKCSVLDPYGFNNQEDEAYILSINNSLLANLSGIPMVYGSSGNMNINKNALSIASSSSGYAEYISISGSTGYLDYDQYYNFPSLIFPGKGFLNEYGYNKTLTCEFWLRISPEENEKRRIFGPLKSKDGIYVDRDFISINVGKHTKSYFIGKWYRPMLVHFCQSENEIYLMINGEKVISILIESLQNETFPEQSQDYLGFYTDKDIYVYEMYSFSIFPYAVQEQVAKKRYVFGQGVQEQENIIATNNGNLSYVEFPFAGYNSTMRYPDRTRWDDAYHNNIVANSEGISLPEYELPEVIFKNTNLSSASISSITSNFYQENYDIQDEDNFFISMDPDNLYIDSEVYGTIYFSKLDKTGYETKSLYSILKSSDNVSAYQSLLYISNDINTDNFEVFIDSGSIQYKFNNTILNSASVTTGSYFAVGMNIDKIQQNYADVVGSFFSNTSSLSLNFAGKENDTFLGKIFSLTINNDFFTDKDEDLIFNTNGFALKNFDTTLYQKNGSYSLVPKINNETMFLDIGVSGYWENSIPLSYFGKDILQLDGNLKYDLDLIQFNIDAPASIFSKSNILSTQFQESLSTKIYVTLQNIANTGNFTYDQYINTEVIGLDRVLDLGNVFNYNNTKFEINDKTIIYPPKDISGFTNYYITIHIELSSNGVKTENVRIKNMAMSSLSFDEGSFYEIKTPTVGKFYPITKSLDQYVFKNKIPVAIDIESSPYLYLSGESGIEVLPSNNGNLLNGISIPINESLKPDQEISGIQMFLMYNEDSLFLEEKTIGKIFSSNDSYSIILVPEYDNKRARVKIYDSENGQELLSSKFFLNGKSVSEIIIEPLVWNSIIISFQPKEENKSVLLLNEIIAQIEIYSGIKVDNVASFTELNPLIQQNISYDKWNEVDDNIWSYWSESSNWIQVLNSVSQDLTLLSVNGENLFNTYLGLSSGVASDSKTLNVSSDSFVILNGATWDNYLT